MQKLTKLMPYVLPAAMLGLVVLVFAVPGAQAQGNIQPSDLTDLNIGLFRGSPLQAIVRIINFLLLIGGLIAFLFVLYGGFLYLTAGGDAARATMGRTVIVNAIIGIIIIFLSLAIVRFFVRQTQGGSPEDSLYTTYLDTTRVG